VTSVYIETELSSEIQTKMNDEIITKIIPGYENVIDECTA